jgi:hypothetical protein
VTLPRGPIDVRFEGVSYRYPDGPLVLHDVDVTIAARRASPSSARRARARRRSPSC